MNTNNPGYVVLFAAVVSAVFTAGIMALHAATEDIAERNAVLFRQKALLDAFGLSQGRKLADEQIAETYRRHIRQGKTIVDEETRASFAVMEAFGTDPATGREKLIGYAFPVWGTGFWARIDGYLAVTPDLDRVVGITFYRHSETPGLGGRITEKSWRDEFGGRRITPPEAGGKYLYIGGEKPSGPGSPRHDRRVDSLTGATGTSNAVDGFLNERIAEFRRAAIQAKMIPPPS